MIVQPAGATPLEPDDLNDLIPRHVRTTGEFNAWEQQNILLGEQWAFEMRRGNVLSTEFIQALHRRMFDNTWVWAGRFRRRDTNIGLPWTQIVTAVRELCANTEFWVTNKTFSEAEIAARFHHRLVFIHPFPNGNGRHGRLAADVLLTRLGRPRFTWGSGDLYDEGHTRTRYLEALRSADAQDFTPLLAFARS